MRGPIEARVCADFNRHTCIEVSRQGGAVTYIPLDVDGFELKTSAVETFDSVYQPLKDYPAERAAKLYAEYAAQLGGSKEVMETLAAITTLPSEVIEMATKAKASKPAAKAAKSVKEPKATKAPAKAAKPAKEPKATKPAAKAPGERKPSAAQLFKDLIMEGEKTDDQIFATVQKEFGLDDNKRGYVKWYRNDLAKKGMNPPAAKE